MKPAAHFGLLALLATLLGAGLPASAAIIGINAASSSAQIHFDDTNSLNPSAVPGLTNLIIPQPVWNGALFNLPNTTDPNTGDSAAASFSATFAALSYALNLTGVQLAQPFLNSGYAVLQVNFSVQYQLDAAGLASQPTLALPFALSGTVLPGGFSSFDGNVIYTSGSLGGIDSANYIYYYNTPGPFSTVAAPALTVGTTPALPANDTLTLSGTFVFKVDPASLNANTVPEPTASLLLLLSLPLLLRRRRA